MQHQDEKAEKFKKAVTNLICSGEEKVKRFRQEFDTYGKLLKSDSELPKLQEKLKNDTEALLSMCTGLEAVEQQIDVPLRIRAIKVRIKAITAVLQFRFYIGGRTILVLDEKPNASLLIKICQDVVAAEQWFNCKDDVECQNDLYALYEFIMLFQVPVDLLKFLIMLQNNCEAGFLKLLVLQRAMEEGARVLIKSGERGALFRLVVVMRPLFTQTLQACLTMYKDQTSLPQQLELAKILVTAYRYELMSSYVIAGRGENGVSLDNITLQGEFDSVILAPNFPRDVSMEAFKQFVAEERRLCKLYLARAFDCLKPISSQLINLFEGMQQWLLYGSILQDIVGQIRKMLTQCTELLEFANQKNGKKRTAAQKLFLSAYCADLTGVFTLWNNLEVLRSNFLLALMRAASGKDKAVTKEISLIIQEGNAETQKEIKKTTVAVRQQVSEFIKLDKQATTMGKQLTAIEAAQKERYARIREKQLAARAALQQSPYIPEVVASVEDAPTEKKPEPTIVKSDVLTRLEHLDAKLIKWGMRLEKNAQTLQQALEDRLRGKDELSAGKKEYIERKLNTSLSNLRAFSSMRARFSRLSQSLPEAEKQEFKLAINASLANIEELLTTAKALFRNVSETLSHVTTFYPQVEAVAAAPVREDDVPTYQFTVSYPEAYQTIWKNMEDIPGDQRLCGDAMIPLVRRDLARLDQGELSAFHVVASCETPGEVLDAHIKFHTSKFNPTQCRLSAGLQVINLFPTGEIDKKHIPKTMYFTCDGVVGDSQGHTEELIPGALQDINESTLRTVTNPMRTLEENPEAVLIAIFRMTRFSFVPDSALYNALFDWQPNTDLNRDYLKAVMAEHLKQLNPEEQLQYVEFLHQFDLEKKLLRIKYDGNDRLTETVTRGMADWLLFKRQRPATVPDETKSVSSGLPLALHLC